MHRLEGELWGMRVREQLIGRIQVLQSGWRRLGRVTEEVKGQARESRWEQPQLLPRFLDSFPAFQNLRSDL